MLMNKLNGQQDCDTVTTKSTSPNSQQTPQQTISSTFTNSAAINNNSQQQEKSLKDCQSSIVMTSKNMQGATQLPNGLGSVGSNSSASSTTSSASGITSNDSYFQAFNNLKTVDMNNNSNISNNNSSSNAHSSNQIQQSQLSQQNNLANAYSMLNNPYLNGAMLNNGLNSQQQNQSLLASMNAVYGGYNLGLPNNGMSQHIPLPPGTNQPNPSSQSNPANTGYCNASNGSQSHLLAAASLANNYQPGGINMHDEHHVYEYLHQLLEEKEKLKELFNEPFNIMLPISAKLLDEEVSRIRVNLFQLGTKETVMLPEPVGPVIQMTEKLYVPVKDHPEFNFVGRILGPRGMTAKQLEQETGCKIMVRGKGSMRDKAKEDQMKGKPNWEHLSDELHVLLTVEDTKNRCEAKLKRAGEEIKRLLVPAAEGEDELKKKQLMELAIINGTYRDGSKIQQNKMNQILIPNGAVISNSNIRSSPSNQMGHPLILSPRLQNSQIINSSQPQPFFTGSTDSTGQLIYATLPTAFYSEQQNQLLNTQGLLEYPNGIELSQAGSIKPQRNLAVGSMRPHPYARVI